MTDQDRTERHSSLASVLAALWMVGMGMAQAATKLPGGSGIGSSPAGSCARAGDACETAPGLPGTCVDLEAAGRVCLEWRCGARYLVEAGEGAARASILAPVIVEQIASPAWVAVDGVGVDLHGGDLLPAHAEVAVAAGGWALLRRVAPASSSGSETERGARFLRLEEGSVRVLERGGCGADVQAGIEAPGIEVAPQAADAHGEVASYRVWTDAYAGRALVDVDAGSGRLLAVRSPEDGALDVIGPGSSFTGPVLQLNGNNKICNKTSVDFKGDHAYFSFQVCALDQAAAEAAAVNADTLKDKAKEKCAAEANCAAKNSCCGGKQLCKPKGLGDPKAGPVEGKPTCTKVQNRTCQPPPNGMLFDCSVIVEELKYKCGCNCSN